LVVRSRFESRTLLKKSGENPLMKAKSETVSPKHINSPTSQLPPTKSQSLNAYHSTTLGRQLKGGEDDASEDKRSHAFNDMVSVQSTVRK
jgi:hypothetical protein